MNMVSLDESLIARLKKGKNHFEVFVDTDAAFALKRGEDIKIEDVISVESIFLDAHQGDHVAESDLESAFNTTDVMEIAKQIIVHGEIQLTQEQRKHILEEKTRKVISIIA